MNLDELLQLAEEFEKRASSAEGNLAGGHKKEMSLQDSMELARKQTEVKQACHHIKKLCDLLENKYKSNGGKGPGIFRFFDSSYHSTMNSLKKTKRELEDAISDLDKNS